MKKLLIGLVLGLFCLVAKAQTQIGTYLTWTTVWENNKWSKADTVSYYIPITFVDDTIYIEGKKYVVDHDTTDADGCFIMFCYDPNKIKTTLALYRENGLIQFSIMYTDSIKTYAIIKNQKDGPRVSH